MSLLLFGFMEIENYVEKDDVIWSKEGLTWEDFKQVRWIEDGYDANIYSQIVIPDEILGQDLQIYASMDPNHSNKLKKSRLSSQLLIHEQYHFNITEYCTRLLRQEIVRIGKGALTKQKLIDLHRKYVKTNDSLQDLYDRESEHNGVWETQRLWELKIDDFLRETDYYEETNINNYYNFNRKRTNYYRYITRTFQENVLPNYRMSLEEAKYGEAYKVIANDKETLVYHFNNGKLTNGGKYKTAITKVISDQTSKEVHFLNSCLLYTSPSPRD